MSRAVVITESEINPTTVRWKFFHRDESGAIICKETKPAELPALAVLNTSSWIWGRTAVPGNSFLSGTPAKMKKVIADTLNTDLSEGRKPNFCIAVPYRPVEEMREYYGAENVVGIEDYYVSLHMHDDLRKGKKEFITPGFGCAGSMLAKEGAEQIASAIENGFDIWMMAGGNTLFPKLQLCEKYFAEKHADSERKKSRFIGFSDGSTSQFYLRGLIDPVHYLGISKAVIPTVDAKAREQIFRAIEGDEGQEIIREFSATDSEAIQKRYVDLEMEDKPITNLTFFPRQLRVTCDSTFPKFKSDEKLILSLEGYSQSSSGYSPSEVLFKALSCGAINPENVVFISIEDVVQKSEEVEIPRRNGLIPSFADLTKVERDAISKIAAELKIDPEVYIAKSNAASSSEYQRIRDVAEKFGIPTVDGGERRAGHGGAPIMVPSKVLRLEFSAGKITQTSGLGRSKREYLISDARGAEGSTAPDWGSLPTREEEKFYGDEYEYSKSAEAAKSSGATPESSAEEINKIKLLLLTAVGIAASSTEEVVGGNVLNVVERPLAEISGKGLFLHLPFKNPNKGTNPYSEIFHIASDQLRAAKFLVISMTIPEKFKNCSREEYLENRNKIFAKLFSDLGIKKPVFITTASTDQSKLLPSFEATLDLRRALTPETVVHEASGGSTPTIRLRL